MAKIDVNYAAIEAAAASIDRYIATHRRHMQAMEAELVQLGTQWHGADYRQVLVQWQELNSEVSASGRLIQELEDRAKLLRWAAQRYAAVQNASISRAKRLR